MVVMQKRKRWLWVLLALVLLVGAGAVAWSRLQRAATAEALVALQPDAEVTVHVDRWLVFEPAGQAPGTGLILYPGGFVDPRAYAPAARAIAAAGYRVVIVPMPLNLAVLGASRARAVQAAFPQLARWAVGGHSLGGAMAARYASRAPDKVQGLVLWASYPAASEDLSARSLPVASIYGTRDGLATVDEVDASRPLLPANTAWTAIEGGNHAQFGWFGPQSGDGEATISREEQQAQTVAATVALLERLAEQ
jgi:pimeloyl-ACP methyl ester carboxylesterase